MLVTISAAVGEGGDGDGDAKRKDVRSVVRIIFKTPE
jgi:hypothetical protein